MNHTNIAYGIYLALTVLLTVWVAMTIHRNSKVFLLEIFHGESKLADAVNSLLQTGFYLVAIGFSFVRLKIDPVEEYDRGKGVYTYHGIDNYQSLIEELGIKTGSFVLVLGALLFFNFFILLSLRNSAKKQTRMQDAVSKIGLTGI
ncbi:MAG TPA: hypothetical protein VI461_05165 [Chitinophagaceae bacterium]|nr:hypothetical protein [Chitinophagaceae bacterium]